MVRLDSKGNLICAGISSIFFLIVFTVFLYDGLPRGSHNFAEFVIGIHLLSSICLTVGAIMGIYKLLVPWMISTIFFMYLMIVVVLHFFRYMPDIKHSIIIAIIVAFEVYCCFALYGVQKAFEEMRRIQPQPYNYLNDKTNYSNHI